MEARARQSIYIRQWHREEKEKKKGGGGREGDWITKGGKEKEKKGRKAIELKKKKCFQRSIGRNTRATGPFQKSSFENQRVLYLLVLRLWDDVVLLSKRNAFVVVGAGVLFG